MGDNERVEESTNQQGVQTPENTNKSTPDQDVHELVEHYRAEAMRYKERAGYLESEMKNALQKRQETKDKASEGKGELLDYIEKLQSEKEALQSQLTGLTQAQVKTEKLSKVKEAFMEAGANPEFVDKLSSTVNLDDVDLDRPVTLKYMVDKTRTEWGPLFVNTSGKVDASIPAPHLRAENVGSVESIKKQLAEESAKGAKADFVKLKELSDQLAEAGVSV